MNKQLAIAQAAREAERDDTSYIVYRLNERMYGYVPLEMWNAFRHSTYASATCALKVEPR